MTDLPSDVYRGCARYGLIPPGARVLGAVSGGADSVALLHALVRLSEGRLAGMQLEVAHLDHGLRGEESAADARFVAVMAAALGLPCHLERLAPGALRRKGVSLEEAARDARLAFLERVAAECGAARIALAHTADDRVEEVLMRFLQGAGIRGLAGIKPSRGRFIRPLIDTGRARIEAWLRSENIPWREDATNRDLHYLRNRVRGRLLPELERCYNPAVRAALSRQAVVLGDEDALLEAVARERYQVLATVETTVEAGARVATTAVSFDCAALLSEHPALQRRLIRLAVEAVGGTLRGLAAVHVEAVRALAAAASPSAMVSLPNGLSAGRYYGRLAVRHREAPVPEYERLLPAPGVYSLPEVGLRLTLEVFGEGGAEAFSGAALFDAGSLRWPLVVRNVRQGDRFQPRGGGGSKKVYRLLSDLKIPKRQRPAIPVLLSEGAIVWVCGLRAAETARPRDRGRIVAGTISPLG
ncbi:MAG: tRNA lysidine(34) synthetase TilS [Pseudomonadota bacterium]